MKAAPPRWILWVAAFAAGSLVTALALLLIPVRKPAAERPVAELPVWGSFLKSGHSAVLAFGAPFFFTANEGLYVRDVRVNSEDEVQRSPELGAISNLLRRPLKGVQPYTGVGEAHGLHLITRFFVERGWNLSVQRAEALRWHDLKKENIIVLGSFRFQTIESKFDPFTHFAHDPSGSPPRIRNLHPLPGEAAEYRARIVNGQGEAYALVTVLPSKALNRRILLLHGQHTWGTQAAAEYVTSMSYLNEMSDSIKRATGATRIPEFLQVLLRVDIKDNQPFAIRYVTFRELKQS